MTAGAASGNRFDRLEWAGAFGDLGTLIPFLVAYISLLLLFGAAVAVVQDPALLDWLAAIKVELRYPSLYLGEIGWNELAVGAVFLALPQAPFTLGSCGFGENKNDRFVSLMVASCAMWNIGVAFVFGMALHHLLKRGLVKL
ncbi:MAG: hypothetical protein HY525_16225 [Betaproteobacteria bacterium]|nr:hypothetical protein [Betaproteobacteria bacterium]